MNEEYDITVFGIEGNRSECYVKKDGVEYLYRNGKFICSFEGVCSHGVRTRYYGFHMEKNGVIPTAEVCEYCKTVLRKFS